MNTRRGPGVGDGWWHRPANIVLIVGMAQLGACDGCFDLDQGGGCGGTPCASDTDCDTTPDLSDRCLDGYCLECRTSSDCPDGGNCDPWTNECYAGSPGGCHYDDDCAIGRRCVDGACRECGSDTDCPEEAVCSNYACVPCRTESQCGLWERCVDATCVCREPCTNSDDCTYGTCGPDGCCGPQPACMEGAGTACEGPGDDFGDVACGILGVCGSVCGEGSPPCAIDEVCQEAPERPSTCIASACSEVGACGTCVPDWETVAGHCSLPGTAPQGAPCVHASGGDAERCAAELYCIGRACEAPCRVGDDDCGEGGTCIPALPVSVIGVLGVCGVACEPGDCASDQWCEPVEFRGRSIAARCMPAPSDTSANTYCAARETLWCAAELGCDPRTDRCREVCRDGDICPTGASCELLDGNIYGLCGPI